MIVGCLFDWCDIFIHELKLATKISLSLHPPTPGVYIYNFHEFNSECNCFRMQNFLDIGEGALGYLVREIVELIRLFKTLYNNLCSLIAWNKQRKILELVTAANIWTCTNIVISLNFFSACSCYLVCVPFIVFGLALNESLSGWRKWLYCFLSNLTDCVLFKYLRPT